MAPARPFQRTLVASKTTPRQRKWPKAFRSTALAPLPSLVISRKIKTKTSKRTSKKGSRRSLKSGDPRKPRSAYAFFVHCFFKEYRRKHPDEKIILVNVSKKCAEKWHSLTKRDKKRFYDMAAMDKSRYMLQYAASSSSGGSKTVMRPKRRTDMSNEDEGYYGIQEDMVDFPGSSYYSSPRNIQVCNCCQREMSDVCSSPRAPRASPGPPPPSIPMTLPRCETGEAALKRARRPIPLACFYPAKLERPSKNPSVSSGRPSRVDESPMAERKPSARKTRRTTGQTTSGNKWRTMLSGRVPTPPPQQQQRYGLNYEDNDDDDGYEDMEDEEDLLEEESSDVEEARSHCKFPNYVQTWAQIHSDPRSRIAAGGRSQRFIPPNDPYAMEVDGDEPRDDLMDDDDDDEGAARYDARGLRTRCTVRPDVTLVASKRRQGCSPGRTGNGRFQSTAQKRKWSDSTEEASKPKRMRPTVQADYYT